MTKAFYFMFRLMQVNGHLYEMVMHLLKLTSHGTLGHVSQSHKIVDSFISFRNFSHSFVLKGQNLLVIHKEYDSLSVEIFGKFIFITFLLFLRIPGTTQPNFSFCFVTNENLSRAYGSYHT